jgi:glucose-1-phosphate cytidylyltransferase
MRDDNLIDSIEYVRDTGTLINGGFFVFKTGIFSYIKTGEELVVEPFARLAAERQLFANKYEGFWAPMDTLKDQQTLEQMAEAGNGPWKVWELGADHEAVETPAI